MLVPCKGSQQELATQRDCHRKTRVENVVFSTYFFSLLPPNDKWICACWKQSSRSERRSDEDCSLSANEEQQRLTRRGLRSFLCHRDFMGSQRITWILVLTETFRSKHIFSSLWRFHLDQQQP